MISTIPLSNTPQSNSESLFPKKFEDSSELPKSLADMYNLSARNSKKTFTGKSKNAPKNVLLFYFSIIILCTLLVGYLYRRETRKENCKSFTYFMYKFLFILLYGCIYFAAI